MRRGNTIFRYESGPVTGTRRRSTPQASGGRVARVTKSTPRSTERPATRALAVLLAGVVLAPALAAPAHALFVVGGGSKRTDCLAVFNTEANHPRRRPRHVRCADGAACDADGTVNGRCEFPVAVCVNSTLEPRCTLAGVDTLAVEHAEDDGDPDFDPDFQALQARIDADLEMPVTAANRCSLAAIVRVPVIGPLRRHRCKKGQKRIRMTAVSTLLDGRRVKVDRDDLRLRCDPAPEGCDPRALFAGTFDRVQRQIFNQSCALSACHDSQSVAGDLLLETGAAHGNLVNVVPSNGPAAAADLRRLAVPAEGLGDLERSYLLMKVTGDLPPGFGARMPFGGPRLDRTLVDVVRLWIAAGAPTEGWVPGTD